MRLISIVIIVSATLLTACGDSKEIAERRGFILQGMRDPASTQFRNETLHKSGWLCGEVNSKNAYGAYVGFRRFISKDSVNAYIEGMNFSGVRSPDHQQIMKAIDLQRKALQEAKRRIEEGSLDRAAAQGWADSQVFEMQWQEYCS